jgi:methylamine dehydrogenase heavy chain
MRGIGSIGLSAVLAVLITMAPLRAEIRPESIAVATLGSPQPGWFFAKPVMGPAGLYDADSGRMLGLLSLSEWTPAVQPHPARGEIYAAESYYSRRIRGERTDVLTIYDTATLAPVHEIVLPDKIASLAFRQYIGLLDDGRHLAVFNMTPAQSVSIVDVQERRFVGEISTPGCALTLPVPGRALLMLCGDGTLQLLRLGRNGSERGRIRSAAFFDVEDDPVFDRPVPTATGWLLPTFAGRVFEVSVDGDDIRVGEPWWLTDESAREAGWRPGGVQILAYHPPRDLLAVLMHVGGVDTHEDPGTQVWLIDRAARRRIATVELEGPVNSLHLTAGDRPLLVAARLEGPLDVYDVESLRKRHSITPSGSSPMLVLQGFAP